jgi:DNA-binding response OmpR family regulator
MNVLVVEDDRALGLFLQKGLKLEGHDVDWVGDGEAAIERAERGVPDLVVLDLSLPRRDGTEVLAHLWAKHPHTSVIVLTGRSKVEDRIHCLNLGADDFLLKPFSFHELTARCRAVRRRRQQTVDATLRYGSVEMNRITRVVKRDGNFVDLTAKEFLLMEFLLQRRGRVCSRAELLREVWQMSPDAGTNVVDVYINYLRKKLAAAHPDGQSSAPVVDTIRGQGYRLLEARCPVSSVAAAEAIAECVHLARA